ncbi:uncharacterized protein N7477_005807 [Penicillium maclennaniae]|uniref:uncharacterized protein n=1 Tax=Penicillium maclennaniae TaxID=1343394 RepID=UPI0025403055|nr:uncharacterized protein N7477_005807 [Penicillium maclennaniae]KAJ5670444.1 hypothetical protein N7477_005807 [Penicillium maclennaniae]
MFNAERNPSPIMDWTTLPPEVFEIILTYLDLDTVKALRLTDRKLAEKCIGPRFLGSIQQPIFAVSSQNLHSLHALACNPALSNLIYSLTFLATSLDSSELEKNVKCGKRTVRQSHGHFITATRVAYSPEELSNVKSNLTWLRGQRRARANESSSEMIELLQLALKGFGELDSIHLDGAVIVGRTQRESTCNDQWHPLWMRASYVFSLVMTAMVQSGTSVKKLNAYRSTPRCCIPSGDITTYALGLNPKQLGILNKGLESLQLSMSAEVQNALDFANALNVLEPDDDTPEGHLSRDDPRAVLVDGTPGITSLLKSAPALRELDLSFRHALEDGTLDSYDRILESIAHEAQFPILEKCALSGFLAKGESILLFLQKHPDLRSFTLHECTLTTGSWTPIFSHLDQSMPRLDDLSFSNLYGKHRQEEDGKQEVDGMVNLQPIWDTDQPPLWKSFSTGGGRQVHTRSFNREELKKGLVFRPLIRGRGRPKGSLEFMRWRDSRRALYGPP